MDCAPLLQYFSTVIILPRASDSLRCPAVFSISPTISTDSESCRKHTCWTSHRLRWNNDEWLMRHLQPPPAVRGRGSIGQDAAVLRCAMCHLPSHLPLSSATADEVFSVGAELHRPLCALHPEHILRDERGYGFEETKRLARDKRICFTATVRGAGDEDRGDGEIWIALSSCRRTTGGSLNCRNRAADNSRRLTGRTYSCGVLRPGLLLELSVALRFCYISRKLRARI